MNFFQFILQDWKVNKGNPKGRFILLLFRIGNFCKRNKIYQIIAIPYLIFYKILIEWIYGMELPWQAEIGKNFRMYHGQGLLLGPDAVIGENCVLRHTTTLGVKELPDGSVTRSPILGNYVDVGTHVCIIGPITIGDHVKIGCGAIVMKDVPPYSIAVGNPAVIKPRKDIDQLLQVNEPAPSIV